MDELKDVIRGRIVPLTQSAKEDLQFKIERLLEAFIEMKDYLDDRFDELEERIDGLGGQFGVEFTMGEEEEGGEGE